MANYATNSSGTTGGSGAATLPSTLILADATTATSPDLLVLRHTTSGTAAANFGVTCAVELQSAAGNVRRVWTDATYLTTATDGSEVAERLISIMSGGSLRTWGTMRMDTASVPSLYFGALANLIGMRRNGTNLELSNSVAIAVVLGSGLQLNRRLMEKQGAAVASASTVDFTSLDGNYYHITGTITINYIGTANWQAGSRVELYFESAALTLTNNAGSVPGGTFALELAGAVNITTTAGMKVVLRMDSTQSKWVEISRSA